MPWTPVDVITSLFCKSTIISSINNFTLKTVQEYRGNTPSELACADVKRNYCKGLRYKESDNKNESNSICKSSEIISFKQKSKSMQVKNKNAMEVNKMLLDAIDEEIHVFRECNDSEKKSSGNM